MSAQKQAQIATWACAIALFGVAILARMQIDVGFILVALAASFVVYAALWWVSDEYWWTASPFLLAIGLSVACTGFIGVAPALSTDVYRYLWDGRALLAGFNPLCVAPQVAGHNIQPEAYDALINHAWLSSPYPPGAQWLFALVVMIGGSYTFFQFLTAAAHALTTSILWRSAPGNSKRAAYLYALNPLLIVESAWSAHIDFFVGLLLLLGATLYSQPKINRAALAWGLAALTKLTGFFPLFWLACRQRKFFLWIAVLVACVAIPNALCATPELTQHGLVQYAERWSGHTVFFPALEHSVYAVLRWLHIFKFPAPTVTRVLIALLLVIWVFYLSRTQANVFLALRASIFGLLLLSPQFHPWYIAWLLPLEAACQRRAGFVLSAAMLATYLPLADWEAARVWSDSALFLGITSTIVCITLLLERGEGLPFVKDASL